MDCDKSIELLSEYSVGSLGEDDSVFVKTHLITCPDCEGVLKDLALIVQTASVMRSDNGLAYPDEEILWQRVSVGRRITH
ncbi:MAG: zf-HC2 domain-containing protein [Acidobacteria bacterium]|nr:zf-HC2 domain-containing protein [Acidobacteriota bacterium]